MFLNIKKNNFNPKQMLRVYKGIIDIHVYICNYVY